jgi:hypothetical protein
MGKLIRELPGGRSQDIITDGRLAIIGEPQGPEPEAEPGPVKTKLDLSLFDKFDGQSVQGKRGKWMSMNVRGDITISHDIGKTLPEDAIVEFYLNRKGNILVMRQSLNGIALCKATRSESRRVSCIALKTRMQELDIKLPARYVTKWDEELRAWVGRREL